MNFKDANEMYTKVIHEEDHLYCPETDIYVRKLNDIDSIQYYVLTKQDVLNFVCVPKDEYDSNWAGYLPGLNGMCCDSAFAKLLYYTDEHDVADSAIEFMYDHWNDGRWYSTYDQEEIMEAIKPMEENIKEKIETARRDLLDEISCVYSNIESETGYSFNYSREYYTGNYMDFLDEVKCEAYVCVCQDVIDKWEDIGGNRYWSSTESRANNIACSYEEIEDYIVRMQDYNTEYVEGLEDLIEKYEDLLKKYDQEEYKRKIFKFVYNMDFDEDTIAFDFPKINDFLKLKSHILNEMLDESIVERFKNDEDAFISNINNDDFELLKQDLCDRIEMAIGHQLVISRSDSVDYANKVYAAERIDGLVAIYEWFQDKFREPLI